MYAGDLSPTESWTALTTDPDAVLVDVRTPMEWSAIGTPDLASVGKEPVLISWQHADGTLATDFLVRLREAGIGEDVTVHFLCRSGQRSASAASAATAAGWTRAHNIAQGFEGPPDSTGRRGTVAGWQASGLPWTRP